MGSFSPNSDELLDFEGLPDKYGWPRENERGYRIQEHLMGRSKLIRVIHIGAGMSGICWTKFLPEKLQNASLVVYDKNEDVGGTWFENRYPGCACDIPSINYQYSWVRSPNWPRFYSSSADIWRYLREVVDRYGLMKYMKLRHQVHAATWDEKAAVWNVEIENLATGERFVDTAEVLINGTGVLNDWRWPEIEGLHSFQGKLLHTANYDTTTQLKGKRVAVIGMGSSGIQCIAEIASQVDELYTFIRSPTWVVGGYGEEFTPPGGGGNGYYTPEQQAEWVRDPKGYLDLCKRVENDINAKFKLLLNDTPQAKMAKEFTTKEMRKKLGDKEELMKRLIPTAFPVGCRRLTPGIGFLEALTQKHVTTFTQGIKHVTPKGFVLEDGKEVEVDVLICATGFNTNWVPRFPIIAHGRNVQDVMAESTVSYLAIALPDFPNYWTGVGTYAALGHGSFVNTIEYVTSHILEIVEKMQKEDIRSLTPRREAANAFVEHADLYLKRLAFSGNCASWYKAGKVDGKLTMFPGSRVAYFDLLAHPRYEDYHFEYDHGNEFAFMGNGFSIKEFDGSDSTYYLGSGDAPYDMLPLHTSAAETKAE